MSFKSFSTAQDTPVKAADADKSRKNAPAASQPKVVPETVTTAIGPQQKP